MSSPKAAAPKPSPKRTLLRDITGDAASKHNVDAQQQEAHGSAKPSGQDMNYFQRQYHSALMSSAIEEHRRYLAQHPEVDAPADNRPIQQPQPNPRRRVAQAPQQRRAGPVHEDVDGYPCPCPDCNMRRYEEAMLEHMPQQHHVPAEPQYEYYGMPAAPVQQVAAHPTGRRSPRQHSPYSFQPVGYSPDNGFYGMTSFPNSPLQPAAAEFAPSFDVPYIPAQHDYTRYAMADENNNTDSSDAAAEEPSGRPTVAEQPPRATRDRSRRPKAEKSPESPQRPRAPQQRNAREERPKKASAPTAAIEPRPACPFALQLRVSRWHTKSVVSPTPYAEGAFVIFEGDRGRDCGEVLSCQAAKEEVNARTPPPAMALALASQDDVTTHRQNERDAAATVETAIAASDKLKLRMKIVGAVYQHDRAKLTFMYESGERVDFRQLLRDLYGEFRCRIWMEVPSQK